MKTSVRWLLFEYKGRELVTLSKGFKTKKLAAKVRQNMLTACVAKSESAWFASPIVDFPEYLKECVRVSPSKYCAYLSVLLVTEMLDIGRRHFGDRM